MDWHLGPLSAEVLVAVTGLALSSCFSPEVDALALPRLALSWRSSPCSHNSHPCLSAVAMRLCNPWTAGVISLVIDEGSPRVPAFGEIFPNLRGSSSSPSLLLGCGSFSDSTSELELADLWSGLRLPVSLPLPSGGSSMMLYSSSGR